MSGYTLIDRPITPFSQREEIEEWIAVCKLNISQSESNTQWRDELAYAESLVKEPLRNTA